MLMPLVVTHFRRTANLSCWRLFQQPTCRVQWETLSLANGRPFISLDPSDDLRHCMLSCSLLLLVFTADHDDHVCHGHQGIGVL